MKKICPAEELQNTFCLSDFILILSAAEGAAQLNFKTGDTVYAFENSGHALGTMVFKYKSEKEMFDKISRLTELVVVEVD